MEVVPGRELRSWQHPFLFRWLPSSDLALLSVGFRAEKRWFPIILTLQPGMFLLWGPGILPAEAYAESGPRRQLDTVCAGGY